MLMRQFINRTHLLYKKYILQRDFQFNSIDRGKMVFYSEIYFFNFIFTYIKQSLFTPMGQQQSKVNDSIKDNYLIIKTLSPVQYWIKNKKKGNELQLRILTFHLEEELLEYIKLLDRRKKIKNPHLFQLIEYERFYNQHMCSSTFQLKTITEFAFKTVKEDIHERNSEKAIKYFTEDQLWSILYSCCHALFTLYANKFPHQSLSTSQVFIDTSGIIKLADAVLVRGTKNYLSLMQEDLAEEDIRYIPPELKNLVDDNNFYLYDKEKSDVYILGMIILQIGCLKPVKYYDLTTKQYHFEIIPHLLSEFKIRYTHKISDIIEKMLETNVQFRPKFQNIIENIEEKTIFTNSNRSSIKDEYISQTQKQYFTDKTRQEHQSEINMRINQNMGEVKQKLVFQNSKQQKSFMSVNEPVKMQSFSSKIQMIQPNITHQTSFRSTLSNNSYQINPSFQPLHQFPPNNLIQPTNLIQQTNYITNNFAHPIPLDNKTIKVGQPPIIYQSYPNIFPLNTPLQMPKLQPKSILLNNQPPIILAQPENRPISNQMSLQNNIKPSLLNQNYIENQYKTAPLYHPQFINHQNVQKVQFNNQPFNSINKNFIANHEKQANYTPYRDLVNFSEGTSQVQSINTVKKQLFINSHTTPIQQLYFPPPRQEIPTKEVKDTHQKQQFGLKNRRFSESKFGGIELPSMNTNNDQLALAKEKALILQQSLHNQAQAQKLNRLTKINPLNSFKIQEEIVQEGNFVIEKSNVGRYEGFKVNNMKNGLGRLFYTDGGYYEGEWKDNHMDGFGKLFYSNENLAYQGYWTKDLFEGKGRIYNNEINNKSDNEINYMDLSQLGQKWLFYEGQFHKDSRHGKGMIKFINKEIFYGTFINDFIEGQGSFHNQDGDIIQGKWSKNIFIPN